MVLGEAAGLQIAHQGECVEVVDVARSLEVRGFMLFRGGLGGFLAVEDGGEGFGGGGLLCGVVGAGDVLSGVRFAGVEILGGFLAYWGFGRRGFLIIWFEFGGLLGRCVLGLSLILLRGRGFHFLLDHAGEGSVTAKVVRHWRLGWWW